MTVTIVFDFHVIIPKHHNIINYLQVANIYNL